MSIIFLSVVILYKNKSLNFILKYKIMDSATVLGFTIAAILIAITGYAIYTAFGPPSAQLSDPFEDHED